MAMGHLKQIRPRLFVNVIYSVSELEILLNYSLKKHAQGWKRNEVNEEWENV